MNRRITFAAAVAVVSSALFAQDSITFVSPIKGTSVAMTAEPITNKMVLCPYTNTVRWVLPPITNKMVLCPCTNTVRWVLSVDIVVERLREQGDMTNLVKNLIESGDVCAVVGHRWEYLPHVTLEYCPDGDYPEHRRCTLCGKIETKEPGAWK